MKKIRIFIVEDHEIVREGYVALLAENPVFLVTGEAGTGVDALEQIARMEFKPQVVLMDINMPDMDGLACTARITELYPEIRVIALTMVEQGAHIRRMLDAGAVGYLLKSESKAELYKAIETVHAGNTYFSPSVSDEMMRQMTRLKKEVPPDQIELSNREKEVLVLILNDLSNQQIAEKLGISIRTVETHKQNLISKTGTNSIAGLVVCALKNNLVDPRQSE